MTPPHAWVKRSPSSCGKVAKKCSASTAKVSGLALEPLVGAAAEVVDGVVAAPEDAPVVGEPVVVEQVAGVGEPVPLGPADGRALLGRERLGDQGVVPHRHDVGRQPAQQRRRNAFGAQRDLARHHLAVRRRETHAGVRPVEPTRPACSRAAGHRAAGTPRAARAPAGPGRPSRLPSRSSTPPTYVGESTFARTWSPSSHSSSPPTRAARAGSSRSSSACQPAVATVSSPVRSKEQSMPRSPTVSSIASRFSRPRRSRVAISSGNRSRPLRRPWVRLAEQKPPLRPDAAHPAVRPSSDHHVAGRDRRPSPAARSTARCTRRRPPRGPRRRRPASAGAVSGAGPSSQNGT